MQTGGIRKNIGDLALNHELDFFSIFYDNQKRVIAQASTNIMGGLNIEFNQYETITNNLLKKSKINHQ